MLALAPSPWLQPGAPISSPHDPRRHHTAAFEAIAATLPLGSAGYDNATNEQGERLVWLAPNGVNRLRPTRGPGESYSDVILRVAKARVQGGQAGFLEALVAYCRARMIR